MSNTINTLKKLKQQGQPISCLTSYDASFTKLIDKANIDVILVGDSLGMVIQGHKDTLKVKMSHMVYHTECVANSISQAFLISDMPFLSYRNPDKALKNAGKLMQAGAQMVKLEGDESIVPIVQHLKSNFIPVCAHIGLKPQQVRQLSGYKIHGTSDYEAQQIINDAKSLTQAGADIILFECTSPHVMHQALKEINTLTIGIGSGSECDGQILVVYDIIGISPQIPSFSQNFLNSADSIQNAIALYGESVKNKTFP